MRESCPLQRFGFCYYPPVFNAFFPLTSPVSFRDCTLAIGRFFPQLMLQGFALVLLFLIYSNPLGSLIEKKWKDHFNIPPTCSTVTFPHCRALNTALYSSAGCKVMASSCTTKRAHRCILFGQYNQR
jgi:hypothetical protein